MPETIPQTSRYHGSPIIAREVAGQVRRTIYPREQAAHSFTFTRVQLGPRRVDQLAYETYGDNTQWWRIADANPEIMDWLDVPPETVLRVPRA